jgi:hypothetical protein
MPSRTLTHRTVCSHRNDSGGLSLERENTKQARKLFRENCIFLYHNNNNSHNFSITNITFDIAYLHLFMMLCKGVGDGKAAISIFRTPPSCW